MNYIDLAVAQSECLRRMRGTKDGREAMEWANTYARLVMLERRVREASTLPAPAARRPQGGTDGTSHLSNHRGDHA